MIETDERPAYMFPDTLSAYAQEEEPGAPRFLVQGAVIGAVLGFLTLANVLYSHPDVYNFFLLFSLLPVLLNGLIFGAFDGSIVWACTRLAHHPLHFLLRGGIGIAVHFGVATFMMVLLEGRLIPQRDFSTWDYLWAIGLYLVFGLVFGLLVGSSRFDPWSELIRGTTTTREDGVAAAITGIALRVVVIFGFMQSVVYLIYEQQVNESREHTVAVIAVVHFIAAVVLVFVRVRSWRLLQLALLVNAPVVLFLTDVVTTRTDPMWTLSIIYVAVWFAFLVTRLTGMPRSRESGARS